MADAPPSLHSSRRRRAVLLGSVAALALAALSNTRPPAAADPPGGASPAPAAGEVLTLRYARQAADDWPEHGLALALALPDLGERLAAVRHTFARWAAVDPSAAMAAADTLDGVGLRRVARLAVIAHLTARHAAQTRSWISTWGDEVDSVRIQALQLVTAKAHEEASHLAEQHLHPQPGSRN